jgi:hypothetical protein
MRAIERQCMGHSRELSVKGRLLLRYSIFGAGSLVAEAESGCMQAPAGAANT